MTYYKEVKRLCQRFLKAANWNKFLKYCSEYLYTHVVDTVGEFRFLLGVIDVQIMLLSQTNSTRITRMLRINTDRVSVLNP